LSRQLPEDVVNKEALTIENISFAISNMEHAAAIKPAWW
jgi:hypothetical protein